MYDAVEAAHRRRSSRTGPSWAASADAPGGAVADGAEPPRRGRARAVTGPAVAGGSIERYEPARRAARRSRRSSRSVPSVPRRHAREQEAHAGPRSARCSRRRASVATSRPPGSRTRATSAGSTATHVAVAHRARRGCRRRRAEASQSTPSARRRVDARRTAGRRAPSRTTQPVAAVLGGDLLGRALPAASRRRGRAPAAYSENPSDAVARAARRAARRSSGARVRADRRGAAHGLPARQDRGDVHAGPRRSSRAACARRTVIVRPLPSRSAHAVDRRRRRTRRARDRSRPQCPARARSSSGRNGPGSRHSPRRCAPSRAAVRS